MTSRQSDRRAARGPDAGTALARAAASRSSSGAPSAATARTGGWDVRALQRRRHALRARRRRLRGAGRPAGRRRRPPRPVAGAASRRPCPTVTGERPIDVDQTNTSVVVGRGARREVAAHASPTGRIRPWPRWPSSARSASTQMPTTYAVLTWTSPRGHTLPVAYVSRATSPRRATAGPGASTWCASLAEPRRRATPGRPTCPRGSGRLTAELHIALATPNHVFPRPMQSAGASRVQRWYDGAFAMLDQALHLPDPDVARGGQRAGRCDRRVLRRRLWATSTSWPARRSSTSTATCTSARSCAGARGWRSSTSTATRWRRRDGGLMHPAARDVAQMTRSLDHVGQVVLHHNPGPGPGADPRVDGRQPRRSSSTPTETRCRSSGMGFLLDERLLAGVRAGAGAARAGLRRATPAALDLRAAGDAHRDAARRAALTAAFQVAGREVHCNARWRILHGREKS